MAREIVVFRPGALGDTLLTCDALQVLRYRYPDASIELVGNAPAGALLRDAGLVDLVTSFDSAEVTGLFRAKPILPARWQGVHVAVVWLASPEPIAAALRGAGVREVIAAHPEPAQPEVHVADHLVASVVPDGQGPFRNSEPLGPVQLRTTARTSPSDPGIILHPGSGSPKKNWPVQQFAAVARALVAGRQPLAVLCGPADEAAIADLAAEMGEHLPPVLTPPDLPSLADVLAGCRLLIGNDSGVSHLSARLAVPTVAIFGVTDPRRWAPRGPRVEVVGGAGRWPSALDVLKTVERIAPGLVGSAGAPLEQDTHRE
jgi:ADP-heptose:LPS heptosyltransferase